MSVRGMYPPFLVPDSYHTQTYLFLMSIASRFAGEVPGRKTRIVGGWEGSGLRQVVEAMAAGADA
jgi:hypothetical protein